MTKQFLFFSFVCLFSLSFCNISKNRPLINTWQAIALENPAMDSDIKSGQLFLDTVGKNTDAAANLALYGVTNIDSMKKLMQQQLDSIKLMQQEALTQTAFTFRKDSVAILKFNGTTDSMKWHMDTDTSITLSNLGSIGSLEQVRMEIITLSDTALKLRFREGNTSSTVTFHPGTKL